MDTADKVLWTVKIIRWLNNKVRENPGILVILVAAWMTGCFYMLWMNKQEIQINSLMQVRMSSGIILSTKIAEKNRNEIQLQSQDFTSPPYRDYLKNSLYILASDIREWKTNDSMAQVELNRINPQVYKLPDPPSYTRGK